MRYPVIVVPFLRVSGMALFPFILLRKGSFQQDPVLMNHERIHMIQQLEMLVIPFYIIYLLNYLINLAIYGNHNKAYLMICFEKEAYNNEKDLNYLSKRRFWRWTKYL